MKKPLSRPVSLTYLNTKAGYTDRACIKASLGVQGLVNVCGYQITEKDLYTRIIDKLSGALFHKIIMAIGADLKKENS